MSKRLRWTLYAGILLLLLLLAILLSLSTGEMRLSLKKIWTVLASGENSIEYSILTKIRLPRIFLGMAVGASLSIAGVMLQGIYRNPLVEPYTLGISGGAALGVSLVLVLGMQQSMGALVLPASGFIGSLFTIFLVYTISIRKGQTRLQSMLLIGVMISFIASSVMMLLMAITTTENLHGIVFWTMGSLDEPNVHLIATAVVASLVSLIISYILVRPLNALRLGEEKAMHLGINTELSIRILFVVSSLLTGICVAVAGIIGFVGLVIPHLLRVFVGSDFRILLICSFLGGASFLLMCDTIARVIIIPNELPVGVITGIIGGTIFILILGRKSKNILR